ncbi:MAG: hypothetical protein ACRD6X_02420 [Pyrinomonadaceae bacterium]
MNVDFEIFEAGPIQKSTDRVHATISKLGHIFLNRRTLEALDQPDAVTLMYDRRRSIIGVMSSTLQRPNAYPLKRKDAKTSRGRMVYAMNFCKHYDINPTETLAFLSPEINKDGILILNLNDVRSVKNV